MAQALYRVGESVGPGTVVSDEFTVHEDGRTIEHVVTSWGQEMLMHGREEDASYHEVFKRPFDAPILVPYTVWHPFTWGGVGPSATWVDVSGSRFDYWRVLCDWWNGEDLTIIEHDVQASPAIFQEFTDCPEPWCYFHYSNFTPEDIEAWRWGILGCTRFRKELIGSVPSALMDMDERWRDWHYCSTGLGKTLREAGFEPHIHGVVNHHRMMDVGGVVAAMEMA